MEWYYAQGDERRGPAGEGELRTLIGTGIVSRDTLVWRSGMGDWKAAGDTELARFFSPNVPPPRAAVAPPAPFPAPAMSASPADAYRPPQSDAVLGTALPGAIPHREVWLVVVVSLVTCGVYNLYLLYKWSEEVNRAIGREKYSPLVVLLASIFTCGLGAAVVESMMAFDLEEAARRHDVPNRQQNLGAIETGLQVGTFVLSSTTGVGGIFTWLGAIGILQAELNKLAPRVAELQT